MRVFSAILAGGLFAVAAPASAQEIMTLANLDWSCGQYHHGPSQKGGESKKVTFVNTRDYRVWPAWINYAGYFAVYPEEVPPGGTFTTWSRVGHYWIMIDGRDWHCIQDITITADAKSYTVN